ncbi:hypothetical protein GP486_003308 [Trichoglossum hirsutum]|uniref:Uncharacterized protein n=1 Tax=Trichoglossum hirsutum TaxID=265104 RepID=A0A9P8RQV7_9PEZI|nr:hypothetical protein GP486_003308 [Trichoglossum hirsutum]
MAKIPLAARRNFRDVWEAKKSEIEAAISQLLGVAWVVEVDPQVLHSCGEGWSKDRPGEVVAGYIEYLIENLRIFLNSYGDDGKEELNVLCEHHQITIVPDDTGRVIYSGCDIKGGVFRILFAAHHLGTNAYDATRYLHEAFLHISPRTGQKMNLIARNSIRTDYLPGIEVVRAAIADILNIPDIRLTPNFEENYAVLDGSRDAPSGWEKNLGAFTLAYFVGLRGTLEYERFAGDAMMQEGFLDVVSGREVSLRIVKKMVKGTYNEAVVEGGVLYLQTTAGDWSCNINDAASNIMELL